MYLTARRDTVSVGGSGRLFLRPCLESPGIATMVLMKRIGVKGCKCRARGAWKEHSHITIAIGLRSWNE